jgi:phage shock protein E
MNWIPFVAALAFVLLLMYLLKRGSNISTARAREHLREGALVIDVRSAYEFSCGHISDAVNFPAEAIETSLPRRIQDKDRVLLLHCQSGVRSSVASKRLQNLGYVNAFNLGSYQRAAQLVGDK